MTTTIATAQTLLTADEFTARFAHHRMELERGFTRVLPRSGAMHGKVCMELGAMLHSHVRQLGLGHVMCNDTFVQTRTEPDTVRGADLLFISYSLLPRGSVPPGVLRVAPELVVEVRSPTDRWPDIIVKVGEYLQFGVKLVVVLDVITTTASLFRDRDDWQQVLDEGDDLDLSEVVPEFRVSVARLFET